MSLFYGGIIALLFLTALIKCLSNNNADSIMVTMTFTLRLMPAYS